MSSPGALLQRLLAGQTGQTPGIVPPQQQPQQQQPPGFFAKGGSFRTDPNARFQALLAAASPLLAASSPGGSLGQGLAGAIQGGLGTANNFQSNQLRQKLINAQINKANADATAAGIPQGQSPEGKLRADQNAGLISRDTADKAIRANQGVLTPAELLGYQTDLRKEFAKAVGPADEAISQSKKVFNLLDSGTPIGIQSAMTVFLQSLDGSVVRDNERIAAQQARGTINALLDRLAKEQGTGMQAQTIDELKVATRAAVQVAQSVKSQHTEFFGGLASQARLNPSNITGASPSISIPSGRTSAPRAAPPAVPGGDVSRQRRAIP